MVKAVIRNVTVDFTCTALVLGLGQEGSSPRVLFGGEEPKQGCRSEITGDSMIMVRP
ncbi:uncharacterized protein SETTUDRAFT_27741 [Exserohilum turcica Et28A]|uniref:Uncharacterized protein n=1 Tax=Exserohilum turcicum (strain 28A) TaxID=671987 RepID=R0KG63_EXST2|nr:uncharacterized protein SETTUDRAFT_27741 [Exserohilum turcica Et28A]EOA88289.1 hypothetical protein SETTUDRAFT_27741 [Exserohilum turcica Et28A]